MLLRKGGRYFGPQAEAFAKPHLFTNGDFSTIHGFYRWRQLSDNGMSQIKNGEDCDQDRGREQICEVWNERTALLNEKLCQHLL